MNQPPAIDPKVLALMAKLEKNNHEDEDKDEQEDGTDFNKTDEKTSFLPPSTLEEFFKIEKITTWPLSTESPLDMKTEGMMLGTQQDIIDILKQAAPLGTHMIDSLEDRLGKIENTLRHFADEIVTDGKQGMEIGDGFFHSPPKTFITETSETEGLKSLGSSKGHKSLDLAESMIEAKKGSLEYCTFPGFRANESIELPSQLEAPPILDRVTRAQDFNPGFKKFWKKIFLSEASVAVIQDTFWWIFLDRFNKEKGLDGDKDLVFDRVADSYVALFTTINTDVKDKVLPVYPDCYAQSLYALYCEAFPESTPMFDEDFKQYLINLAHEWITGLKPVPGTYNNWNMNGLKPGLPKGTKADENVVAAKQMIQAAALNKNVSITLDIESFTKLVDRLGHEKQMSPSTSPHGFPRESTKTTTTTITSGSRNTPLPTTHTKLRAKQVIESHQIGPGPEYERVKFNTQGRSPLISHYLYMRQLRDLKQPGQKLRRTEIAKLPPPGQTYQQLIQNTLSLSNALNKEYQKICDETNQGIIDLEKRKVEMNKEIDALQKELLFTRNPHDLKILCEKIAALREKSKELPMTVDSKSSDSRQSSIIEENLTKSPKL